jgi:hypothetical protein
MRFKNQERERAVGLNVYSSLRPALAEPFNCGVICCNTFSVDTGDIGRLEVPRPADAVL